MAAQQVEDRIVAVKGATMHSTLPNVNRTVDLPGVEEVTWLSGRVEFRCMKCGKGFDRAKQVPPHLSAHQGKRVAHLAVAPATEATDTSRLLAEVNALVANAVESAVTRHQNDALEWKGRALAAEKKLRTLRSALGVE